MRGDPGHRRVEVAPVSAASMPLRKVYPFQNAFRIRDVAKWVYICVDDQSPNVASSSIIIEEVVKILLKCNKRDNSHGLTQELYATPKSLNQIDWSLGVAYLSS